MMPQTGPRPIYTRPLRAQQQRQGTTRAAAFSADGRFSTAGRREGREVQADRGRRWAPDSNGSSSGQTSDASDAVSAGWSWRARAAARDGRASGIRRAAGIWSSAPGWAARRRCRLRGSATAAASGTEARTAALREGERRPDEGLPAAAAVWRRRSPQEPLPITRTITVTEGISVKDLAEKLEVRGKDLIATLLMKGVFVTVNQSLDGELVKEVARQFGADAQVISFEEQMENEAIEGFLRRTRGAGDYASAGGDGDGPRRSRQDVAAGCDPLDGRGGRRSGRDHAAHRRVQGEDHASRIRRRSGARLCSWIRRVTKRLRGCARAARRSRTSW